MKIRRISVPDIRARKGGEPLVCLTAYTTPMAALLDARADLLLVGDSLGMVLYGLNSTVEVDLDLMIRHGACVSKASQRACVVVDMPFGSYQESPEQAFRNAARILKETGCAAVKLEGGEEMAETVAFLSVRGIPVMGHVGLQPQSVNVLGGYGARGRNDADSDKIFSDARAIAQAGAFSIVLEAVVEPLAAQITRSVEIPTIGIGASAMCDGQILVTEDMLGLTTGRKPAFVKEYADLSSAIDKAVSSYAEDVRSRKFPAAEHTYRKTGT